MRLLFVGDGERDAQTVPLLVEGILDIPIKVEMRNWFRLHGSGRGYDRKMLFSLRLARDQRVCGLVATVDRDKDPRRRRLAQLRKGLDKDRESHPPIPTALGEAVPHGEAWLLDDSAAVREVLCLAAEVKIPAVGKVDPKAALNGLISESSLASERMMALRDIARAVETSRCPNAKKTGLATFVKDVKSELGPLVASRRASS